MNSKLSHPDDIELEFDTSSSSSSSQSSISEETKESYYQHVQHGVQRLYRIHDDLTWDRIDITNIKDVMQELDFIVVYDPEKEKPIPSRHTTKALASGLRALTDQQSISNDNWFNKAVNMMDYLYEWRVEMGIIFDYMQRLIKRIEDRIDLFPPVTFLVTLLRLNNFPHSNTK